MAVDPLDSSAGSPSDRDDGDDHQGEVIGTEVRDLLSPGYAERRDERKETVDLLERVLDGLQALEVAATPDEREAALAALPEATGEDDELDRMLADLKSSSIWVSDFGMAVRVAIGRARYVRQLTRPTRLRTKLPVLYGHPKDRQRRHEG